MRYQIYRLNKESLSLDPLPSLHLDFESIPSIHDERFYVILNNIPVEVSLSFMGESGDDCVEHNFNLRANDLHLGTLKLIESIEE